MCHTYRTRRRPWSVPARPALPARARADTGLVRDGMTAAADAVGQVDEWHGRYVQALRDLYDQHKDKYDRDRVRDLQILG